MPLLLTRHAIRRWVVLLLLVASVPALAATPTLVQHLATGMTSNPLTTFTITLPNRSAAGNALILGMQFNSAGTISSVGRRCGQRLDPRALGD